MKNKAGIMDELSDLDLSIFNKETEASPETSGRVTIPEGTQQFSLDIFSKEYKGSRTATADKENVNGHKSSKTDKVFEKVENNQIHTNKDDLKEREPNDNKRVDCEVGRITYKVPMGQDKDCLYTEQYMTNSNTMY